MATHLIGSVDKPLTSPLHRAPRLIAPEPVSQRFLLTTLLLILVNPAYKHPNIQTDSTENTTSRTEVKISTGLSIVVQAPLFSISETPRQCCFFSYLLSLF